jgi:hypothetical protein
MSAGKQVDENNGAEVTKLTDGIEALKKDGEAAAEEIKEVARNGGGVPG